MAMTITKGLFLSLIFSLFVFSPLASATMVVNGSLDDWGVTPGAYDSINPQAQWVPSTAGVTYVSEDQIDYSLNPGYGGQDFDVEAIYFKKEGDIAYFAVVSGFPIGGYPNYNGSAYYAGDLAIDFGSNGSYEFGVTVTNHLSGVAPDHLVGNAATDWSTPYFTESGPFQLTGGTDLGAVQFAYNSTTYLVGDHYVYEYGIPVSLFGADWTGDNPDLTVHWTMSCGNDALDLHVNAVLNPEPSTYALLLLGLSSFGLLRRFRNTRTA